MIGGGGTDWGVRAPPSLREEYSMGAALPKWPAIAVEGKPVTKEQAAEIIIRTDSWQFFVNDDDWERQLYECAGVSIGKYGIPNRDEFAAAKEKLRVLPLNYLNNERIATCYVGGPSGWCDWDGNIFINNKNIGKWPSVEDALEDWRSIASAFPYLDLRCQLFNGEFCEDGISPVVEYRVIGGKASVGELGPPMKVSRDYTRKWGERGCTLDAFKLALKLAKGC